MQDWTGRRYWLIGASEGLGLALAQEMAAAGAEVIISARSADRLAEALSGLPPTARAVTMDVGSAFSVRAAAEQVGQVDGVVYLAGVYWPMTAQKWDAERALQMIDVNLMGCMRVLGAVLPAMVARDAGHVVITGSLSAYRGLPGAVGYAASKAALASLAETLQLDLRKTGVRVQLANPGFIRTRLTDKNDFSMPQIMSHRPPPAPCLPI